MKHFAILSTLILCFSSLFSQITLDSSDYVHAGQTLKMAVVKNLGVIQPGSSGMQTWDFSGLRADTYRLRTFIDPNTLPGGSAFPGASLVTTDDKGTQYYFNKNADSIAMMGLFGDPLGINFRGRFTFTPAAAVMKFPFTYNTTYNTRSVIDTVKDTIISMIMADSVRMVITNTNNITCTSYGTILTPGGSYQAILVRQEERSVRQAYIHTAFGGWTASPFITLKDSALYYRWFAKGRGQEMVYAKYNLATGQIVDAEFLLSDSLFGFIDDIIRPDCYGNSTGEATVKAIVGSGNYTYQWSANAGGQATAKATGLKAGNYTVTISDLVLNQTFVDTLKLTQPDSLFLTLLTKKDEDSVRNNGVLEVSATGGTSPYAFAWSGTVGSTTGIATGLKGGAYSVTVTDQHGCTDTYTDTLATIGNAIGIHSAGSKPANRIYPNPASEYINIFSSEFPKSLRLLNISGAKVMEIPAQKGLQRISLHNLPLGIYLLEITTDFEKEVLKLTVR